MESRNLTIMMTDIQGFTQRTSKMSRDEIENLLHRHEQILGPVFGEHGGTVVKTIGDAFLVTFPSATNALQAGMHIQRELAAHNAGADEDEKLRVRVVLNAGEVNVRDGDVFGEPVNVTARVEGVGEAGHVTFTEAVRLLLGNDSLPLESLGDFELKGIPKAVRLHRVVPDWHVEANRPSEEAVAVETPVALSTAGSASSLWGGLLALVILAALAWGVLEQSDPLAEARALVEAGRSRPALEKLDRLLRSAPGNGEALALQRRCRLALLGEALTARDFARALDQAEILLKRDRKDEQVLRLTLRAVEGGVSAAIEDGRLDEGMTLLGRLEAMAPDDPALKALRAKLGIASLRSLYDKAMGLRETGMARVLAVFKEGGFEGTLGRLRREGQQGAELDWLEARYLMLRIAGLSPAEFEAQSSYSRPDLGKTVRLYARALEADGSHRRAREAFPELKAMLKLCPVEPRLADLGRQLRKILVAHHGKWIAEALTSIATTEPIAEDGKGNMDFAYRLRHHARAMLADLGAESRVDRGRLLRLDLKWLEAHESDDHDLKTRLARISSEVAALGEKGLVADMADALRRMAGRGDEHWIRRANEGLSALGEKTEADDWALQRAGLDSAGSNLSYEANRNPKQLSRQEWPKKHILELLEEVGRLRSPVLRKEAGAYLRIFADTLKEIFPQGEAQARRLAADLK